MAKAQSMNLIEFEKLLGTEEKCEAYFMQKRWKDGFICPNCQHREYYYLQTRKLFECQSCKTQTSIARKRPSGCGRPTGATSRRR